MKKRGEPHRVLRGLATPLKRLPFRTGTAFLCLVSSAIAAPTTINVFADGKKLAPAPVQTISHAHQVLFEVGDYPKLTSGSERMRYKLEGFDADWRERTGIMNLGVCFYNEAGDRVGLQTFEMVGRSPGWQDTLAGSVFLHHGKTVVVPPGATRAGIAISSAGPDVAVGVLLVKNVVLSGPTGKEGVSRLLLDSSPFLKTHGKAGADAPKWVPDGTRPSMSKIIDVPGPEMPVPVFAIIDDDLGTHCEWRSVKENAPRVVPGETLAVEWDDLYENGMGDSATCAYPELPPGRYRFRVQEVDIWGHPLPSESAVDLVVPIPYWQTTWFWTTCAGAGVLVLVFGTRYAIRINVRRHLQRQKLVEQERLRIARDLHDDLGARLAYISLVSSHPGLGPSGNDAQSRLQTISETAGEVVSALSEIVWTVNPENDRLQSLVSFLCRRIQRECETLGIRSRIDSLGVTDNRAVSSDVRHHVSLAVREAASNALKHSGTRELGVRIAFDAPLLKIAISDSGKGFSPEVPPEGNGLANMRKRMAAVGGAVAVESSPGGGTVIRFEIPLP